MALNESFKRLKLRYRTYFRFPMSYLPLNDRIWSLGASAPYETTGHLGACGLVSSSRKPNFEFTLFPQLQSRQAQYVLTGVGLFFTPRWA